MKTYWINEQSQGFNPFKINDGWIEIDYDKAKEALEKINTAPTYTWEYNIITKEFTYTARAIDYDSLLKYNAKIYLMETDYLMTPDTLAEMLENKQIQLTGYRKYLRRVMSCTEDLTGITELKTLDEF